MHKKNIFKDRIDGGQQLAKKLLKYKTEKPLILALPRGGVPIGFEVANILEAPLDTIVACKIGTPSNPEFGFGAVAPGDVVIIDNTLVKFLGLKQQDVDFVLNNGLIEMDRRMVHYKSGTYSKNFSPKTVIIVDDGVATGITARAAIEAVRLTYHPQKIILAAPVIAKDAVLKIKKEIDDVVAVHEEDNLVAVSYWYSQFGQTSDQEVIDLLEKARIFRRKNEKEAKVNRNLHLPYAL